MVERKLDIFQLLKSSDLRDADWFSKQPKDAQKEFASPVVLRWASSIEGSAREIAYMLWIVNERVNVNLFALHQHPELVYRLLASCGIGKSFRHTWLPFHKRKGGENKAYDFIAEMNPDANQNEIEIILSKYTKETFSQFLKECGIQADESKSIVKAYEQLKVGS